VLDGAGKAGGPKLALDLCDGGGIHAEVLTERIELASVELAVARAKVS